MPPLPEEQILQFIGARYGARNLFYLPPQVAAAVCKRPADFIRAAKQYCQPELELRVERPDPEGLKV